MTIIIETIPHLNQRYSTCGDWFRDKDGTLHIKVSQEVGQKEAMLIALHELVEVLLCEDRGVTQEQVDAFDMQFEKNREPGNEDEPGDSPFAPYKKEHFFATNIERLMAAEYGIDWNEYDEKIMSLP
jgi:hypothetical protein